MDIPDDLNALKRLQLQKLCKAHGIKANMKNVDMIEALKEKRNQLASVNVSSSEEAGSPCNTSHEHQCEEQSLVNEVMPESASKSTATDSSDVKQAPPMEDDVNVPQQEELKENEPISHSSQELDTNMTTETVVVPKDNTIKDDIVKSTDEDADPSMMRIKQVSVENTCQQTTSEVNEEEQALNPTSEGNEEEQALNPTSEGNEEEQALNTTYTIESPERLVDDPEEVLSSSLCTPRDHSPSTPVQGIWASNIDRGTTNKDSPLLCQHAVSHSRPSSLADDAKDAASGKENRSIHYNDIMALIDARVEERKRDPNYVAKETATKIPVSSKPKGISDRFNQIHEKEFSKMTSITDSCSRKRRRTGAREESSSNTQEPAIKKQKTDVVKKATKSKPKFDLKESLKNRKPTTYTPYKGRLPKYTSAK